MAEGNSIKTTGDYKALVAPQTLPAGTVFLEVTMSDGRSDEYVLPEDVELKSGFIQPVSIEVTPDGLDVDFGTPVKWQGETVGTEGESPEVAPDANGDKWEPNGDNVQTVGETSEQKPANGNPSEWDGETSEVKAGKKDSQTENNNN